MNKLKLKTEDVTPTWEQILPFMLHIVKSSKNLKQVDTIEKEFLRMAKAADSLNEMLKKSLESNP